jgi:hypothetical protein
MGSYHNQPEFATIATQITASDTFNTANFLNGSALFIGDGGDVSVIMKGIDGVLGNAIVFKNVPSGAFLPVIIDYVTATGTTATNIIAIK